MNAVNTQAQPLDLRAILDALVEPLTVHQLVDITGQPREAVRARINQLREKGFIKPNIEDGHITYQRCARRERCGRGAKPAPTARAPSPGRTPPPATPHPMRGRRGHAKTGLTDDLRMVLREASEPLGADAIGNLLPQYTQNQIASILSQRTRQGEFVARPAVGRGRRYWLASRPWPQDPRAEAAAPAPAPAPEPVAQDTPSPDPDELTPAQAIAELRAHEHYLRETAQGMVISADRFCRLIAALQS